MAMDQGRATSESWNLFVYGSLMDTDVLEGVIGHVHRGERLRARLKGYKRISASGWTYPALVPQAGAYTDGVLVTGLSDTELEALDRYEEVTEGVYLRATVKVTVGESASAGALVAAQTYVAGPVLLNLLAAGSEAGRAPLS
jgi:gamma-glutamylcyclotransferase (GGCT)/AIG2-like uncharacterized protein YtfP